MYKLKVLDGASKDLARLDKSLARRIVNRLRWLATNFDAIQPEGLTGDLAGLCKLRIGDYRVIYQVVNKESLIIIHFIGHRRDVYRRR